ncbi:sugar ABC transporter permease [Paenibacillus sp. F411]|uniref:ABC transporter permease n=1 Tax=Paenibacillus sp. F411 TaxID=2820239 RepID=UPI001AAEA506|nr:sugar ABC transporter permease [Paenibacillus sp. F411]MBO2942650.1 sugar ABC transporter permease [Paenibacillus sp. F411]
MESGHNVQHKHMNPSKSERLWALMVRYRWCYLLAAPTTLFFILFKYVPLWGNILAFQDYNPFRGFAESEWVGFEHFRVFFGYEDFWILLRNTLAISFLGLFLSFPLPIVLALILNEVRQEKFKRVAQSIVYLPHFLSWVVVASFTYLFLSTDVGLVNKFLVFIGQDPVSILTNPNAFWLMLTGQSIWKEVGWGTIIFLAAIAGVDPQQYEAALLDGANRMRQIWHITLPAISGTIVILIILRMGSMLEVGFEQVLLMQNPLVQPVAEVFDTYVYKRGLLSGQFSYGVAVGVFKSVASLILIVSANQLAKRFGQQGLY